MLGAIVKIKEGCCSGISGEIVKIEGNQIYVEVDYHTVVKTHIENIE